MQDFKSSDTFVNLGHIMLVNDPIAYALEFHANKNPQFFKIFCLEELNMELAHAIIDESYIASAQTKTILIAANTFNIYAQNALLKILEEPPNNIVFVIFAKMKSLLLSTICSRLPVFNRLETQKLPAFSIAIESLSLDTIYTYIKEKEKDFTSNARLEVQSLFLDCIAYGLHFNKEEIKMFEKALLWSAQHDRVHFIFLPLLMLVFRKKMDFKKNNL